MKKLITVLLILTLLLPAAALAVTPITGCWYLFYDGAYTMDAETARRFMGYDYDILIYRIARNGKIYAAETSALNNEGQSSFSTLGIWRRSEEKGYYYTVEGVGTGRIIQEGDDTLLIEAVGEPGSFFRFRKLAPLSMDDDYVRVDE